MLCANLKVLVGCNIGFRQACNIDDRQWLTIVPWGLHIIVARGSTGTVISSRSIIVTWTAIHVISVSTKHIKAMEVISEGGYPNFKKNRLKNIKSIFQDKYIYNTKMDKLVQTMSTHHQHLNWCRGIHCHRCRGIQSWQINVSHSTKAPVWHGKPSCAWKSDVLSVTI